MSDRLERAETYIRSTKSLYDHYNMQGVKDSVRQWAGVPDFTQAEAIEIVQRVRNEKGWGSIEDHKILDFEEVEPGDVVFCLRCQIIHNGGQC